MTLNQARKIALAAGVKSAGGFPALLSKPDSNPKVLKNMRLGVLTCPLHLAPSWISGYNVCADSTPACEEACLNTAGNPLYFPAKAASRLAKTILYFENRAAYMVLLFADLRWLARQAARRNMIAGWRPNATSDVWYELIQLNGITAIEYAQSLGIIVYDYTKSFKRALQQLYHLTFSYSGENTGDCQIILANGGTVAVVFGDGLPDSYLGYPVLNGDLSDWRPADKPSHVIGLKAKGRAKQDTSGFVVWNNS